MSDSLATPWTVACQVPLSVEFSRQECWSGLPFPILEWVEPVISCRGKHWQVDFLPRSPQGNDAGLNSFTSEHLKMKILYTLQGCWEG